QDARPISEQMLRARLWRAPGLCLVHVQRLRPPRPSRGGGRGLFHPRPPFAQQILAPTPWRPPPPPRPNPPPPPALSPPLPSSSLLTIDSSSSIARSKVKRGTSVLGSSAMALSVRRVVAAF